MSRSSLEQGAWSLLILKGLDPHPSHHPGRHPHRAEADRSSSWRARLARAVSFVDPEEAGAYLGSVVEPALADVAHELHAASVPAEVSSGTGEAAEESEGGGLPWVQLATTGGDPFVYRVQVCESPVPTYGGRMVGDRDRYARLEVYTVDGGQNYDVMGYSASQVIDDCLDQYERHLEFLRLA